MAATLPFLPSSARFREHRQLVPKASITALLVPSKARSNRIPFLGNSRYPTNLHPRRSVSIIYSSNPSPSGGDLIKNESNNTTSSGPPFLTILAGIFVFLLVCWAVGSVVAWLIGLVSNLPSSK